MAFTVPAVAAMNLPTMLSWDGCFDFDIFWLTVKKKLLLAHFPWGCLAFGMFFFQQVACGCELSLQTQRNSLRCSFATTCFSESKFVRHRQASVYAQNYSFSVFYWIHFFPCANPTDLTPAGKVTPHWVLWTVWPRRSFCCSCWVKQSLMHRCLLFKVRNIDERLLRTGHCMWLHVYPHFSMSGMGRCWSFWELKFQYYEIQLLWFLATADL